jgi:hypothetical protein
MPNVLLSVIGALGGPFGVGGALIGNAIGLNIDGGILGNLLGIGPSGPKPSDVQQIVREAVASRRRLYGRVHVSGALSFYESSDGTLAMVVTTGTGRLYQIVEHRLNNKIVAVGAGGVLSDAKFQGAIRILSRLGEDDQTAVSELTAIFPEWTADHRQRGCSLAVILCAPVKQKNFSQVYEANRQPEYTQVAEGAFCYDPRKDSTAGGAGGHRLNDAETWEWTDNAALIVADYWSHADGYGAGSANVNWLNIAAEATICDQTLTTVDAQTIARWRIWGSYSLATDERKTVLQNMLKACDGYCWQDADGKLNLQVGRWIEPTIHINDNHIISLAGGLGAKATSYVNEVKVVYTDARFDYSEQESAPVVDLVAQAALGRPESQRFDIYYAPHHNQAVRLGKRLLAKLSDRWNLVVVVNLFGLNLIGERFCRLTCAELGIEAVAFEVSSLRIDFEAGTVEVGLSEVRASDWDFDADLEEGTPPAEPGDTSSTPTVPAPTGLTLTGVPLTVGATAGVGIHATWDAPSREGLEAIAQFRETSGAWADMPVNQDDRVATSPIVSSGILHEVRVKHVTLAGRESDWSAVVTITPSADNSAVGPPTTLTATGGGTGKAIIGWRNPVSSTFGFTRVWENTTNNFATATRRGDFIGALGEVASKTINGLSAGTHYFWVQAFNDAGTVSSSAVGPATATVI